MSNAVYNLDEVVNNCFNNILSGRMSNVVFSDKWGVELSSKLKEHFARYEKSFWAKTFTPPQWSITDKNTSNVKAILGNLIAMDKHYKEYKKLHIEYLKTEKERSKLYNP
jgi:hypothetical protein